MVFQSWEGSGPLHGQKVATPYPSKDQLQQKRSIAQTMDTTYVYDFVELFRQVDVIFITSLFAVLSCDPILQSMFINLMHTGCHISMGQIC